MCARQTTPFWQQARLHKHPCRRVAGVSLCKLQSFGHVKRIRESDISS